MKKNILIFFLFTFLGIKGQEVTFSIYNINEEPLVDVLIKNLKTNKTYTIDNGIVTIKGNASDTILFIKDGFSDTELTINNIRNSNNKVYLFSQLKISLSEVVIMPTDMYALYEQAVQNLSKKLVKNKHFGYKCVGVEKEINLGSERGMEFVFTAILKNSNLSKQKLNYDYHLCELNTSSNSGNNSQIMLDNKYRIFLFREFLKKEIIKSKNNTISESDSTIVIYDNSNDNSNISYTINKSDTTLIGINYELVKSQKQYTNRRTFKAKNIHESVQIKYSCNEEGYYLDNINLVYDTSFLLDNSKREERLTCIYKVIFLNSPPKAYLKFTPRNKDLYKIGIYNP